MDYKKPQSTLVQGGAGIYPLTTADQVLRKDKSRLEKDGKVYADVLGGKSLAEIMLALYPVGVVYISVNSTSPASLFGGTWEQIGDRFLLAAGSTYSAGSMGGEATHTMTVDEMPTHSHNLVIELYGSQSGGSGVGFVGTGVGSLSWGMAGTTEAGGLQPHNNMPPYLVVYMWKRVS